MIDIIIPAYNNSDITSRCVAAVSVFKPKGAKVFLIDNGSQDEVFKQKIPELCSLLGVDYHRIETNRGPYGAVNFGLALGTQEFVAVVCNDVVVLPHTIQTLVGIIQTTDNTIQAVGATAPLSTKEWDYAELVIAAKHEGLLENKIMTSQGHFTCFAAKRSLFDEDNVGLFDENFRITFGDSDWEERYRCKGYTYVQSLAGVVYHGHSVTRKRMGIDKDVSDNDIDHDYFISKWKDNEDVMRRHGKTGDLNASKQATEFFWNKQGEK